MNRMPDFGDFFNVEGDLKQKKDAQGIPLRLLNVSYLRGYLLAARTTRDTPMTPNKPSAIKAIRPTLLPAPTSSKKPVFGSWVGLATITPPPSAVGEAIPAT